MFYPFTCTGFVESADEVTLYDHSNYGGKQMTTQSNTKNLDDHDMEDRVSSVKVKGWCIHTFYNFVMVWEITQLIYQT